LFVEMFDGQERPNAARFVFLDPHARDFYLDWDRIARDVVATLRSAAGRDPCDRDLTDLVGELSTRSSRSPTSRWKNCLTPLLNDERLEEVFDTRLTFFACTADPGTRSAEALSLLGSLAATAGAS
jgi:hypothetical protein